MTTSRLSTTNRTTRGMATENLANMAESLNLSHELRTPTNAILGHVELLLSGVMGPLTADMRGSLGDIQRAAINLAARLDDIVALAEVMPVSPQRGEASDHVASSADTAKIRATAQSAER